MRPCSTGCANHHDEERSSPTYVSAYGIKSGVAALELRHQHLFDVGKEGGSGHRAVEAAVPEGKTVHAVLDNYAVHKHPKVKAWPARHPRWTFHFTPTSCSWLNAVEGFFAKLTKRRLKRGVFSSLVDLQAAINRFVTEHNKREAKPFT